MRSQHLVLIYMCVNAKCEFVLPLLITFLVHYESDCLERECNDEQYLLSSSIQLLTARITANITTP